MGFFDKINAFKVGRGLLDSFTGSKAKESSEAAASNQLDSGYQSISLYRQQLSDIEKMTAPYREAATNTALPQLLGLATGGEINYQPSQLYNRQLETGREGLLQSRSALGNLRSSGTFEKMADLQTGLADQDLMRFEQSLQKLLNSGINATNTLGQVGQQVSGAASNIYDNLGQNISKTNQMAGNATALGYQNLSNLSSGIGSLMEGRK